MPERLVWSLVVIRLAKRVELALLPLPGRRGRARGLRFERAVHALMPAILLGLPGFDELWANA